MRVARTTNNRRIQISPISSSWRFYAQFENSNQTTAAKLLNDGTAFQVTNADVYKLFKWVNKAQGLEGISPCVLRSCVCQLSQVFVHIFQYFLKKMSIVPLPKKWPLTGQCLLIYCSICYDEVPGTTGYVLHKRQYSFHYRSVTVRLPMQPLRQDHLCCSSHYPDSSGKEKHLQWGPHWKSGTFFGPEPLPDLYS